MEVLEVMSLGTNYMKDKGTSRSCDFEHLYRLNRYLNTEAAVWKGYFGTLERPNYAALKEVFPQLESFENGVLRKYIALLKQVYNKPRVWNYLLEQHKQSGTNNSINREKLDSGEFRSLDEEQMLNILNGIKVGDLSSRKSVRTASWFLLNKTMFRNAIDKCSKKNKTLTEGQRRQNIDKFMQWSVSSKGEELVLCRDLKSMEEFVRKNKKTFASTITQQKNRGRPPLLLNTQVEEETKTNFSSVYGGLVLSSLEQVKQKVHAVLVFWSPEVQLHKFKPILDYGGVFFIVMNSFFDIQQVLQQNPDLNLLYERVTSFKLGKRKADEPNPQTTYYIGAFSYVRSSLKKRNKATIQKTNIISTIHSTMVMKNCAATQFSKEFYDLILFDFVPVNFPENPIILHFDPNGLQSLLSSIHNGWKWLCVISDPQKHQDLSAPTIANWLVQFVTQEDLKKFITLAEEEKKHPSTPQVKLSRPEVSRTRSINRYRTSVPSTSRGTTERELRLRLQRQRVNKFIDDEALDYGEEQEDEEDDEIF
jgi:hypothetical protein